MSAEEWRPVPGFQGRYEVSDLGRIRSLLRGGDPRPISQRPGWNGYPSARLSVGDGRERGLYVHTLVMLAFVGPRPAGMETRHLNGDRTDARLVNLAYGTHSENMQDRLAHGMNPSANKTHCPAGHPYEGANLQTVLSGGKFRKRVCRTCSVERKAAARRASGIKPREVGPSRSERLAADPTVVAHGRSGTYTHWGCRCDACREAHAAARRVERAKAASA